MVVDAGGISLQVAMDVAATGNSVYFLSDGPPVYSLPRNITVRAAASLASDSLVDSVGSAVEAIAPDTVMLLSDDHIIRTWRENPPWASLASPSVPKEYRHFYEDKHALVAFVESLGVPVPKTVPMQSADDVAIDSVIEALGLPLVVKGSQGAGGQQVRICRSRADVRAAMEALQRMTGRYPALQEFIQGPAFQAVGLFEHGAPIHFWTAEKIAIYPPEKGPAIALRSHFDERLSAASMTLFAGLRADGFAGADFMRGPDGHYRFLECDPRLWGSYAFASRLDMDLIGSWCKQLQGEAMPVSMDFPCNRSWAKMPEYLFVDPNSRSSILRRMLDPLAMGSWAWSSPYLLKMQLRRTAWALKAAGRKPGK